MHDGCTFVWMHHAGQRSRLVGMRTAPVVTGPNSDGFIATKESRRFPEMPALPPLVSMLLNTHVQMYFDYGYNKL